MMIAVSFVAVTNLHSFQEVPSLDDLDLVLMAELWAVGL
jgi:hypothetical protein